VRQFERHYFAQIFSPQPDFASDWLLILGESLRTPKFLISQRESYRNLSGSTLRTVQSPVPEPEELANGLDDLQSALEQRNLPHLVAAVQHLVPEYQPTTQIRKGAAAVAAVNV